MQNQYQTTFAPFVGSSKFDLSHDHKTTFRAGKLVPEMTVEISPGDVAREQTTFATRFLALQAPMLERVNQYTYNFYVPYRLIWHDFKYWIAGTEAPVNDGSFITPTHPTITIDGTNWDKFGESSLADYLGVPPLTEAPAQPLTISALPFRAYQFIYNEFFRNQDLEPDGQGLFFTNLNTVSKTEEAGLLQMRYKYWEKDYFTSSFTEPQQGAPVNIPFLFQGNTTNANGTLLYRPGAGNFVPATGALNVGGSAGNNMKYLTDKDGNYVGIKLDFQNGATISDQLTAQQLQLFLNLDKRGGQRYNEILMAHYNVRLSDARFQRPQFLGGGKSPVSVSEVTQTSESTEDSPLGSYAGRAVSFGTNHGFKACYFEEHGIILQLTCVLPRSSYSQGIEKLWTRFDRLDYYWPEFAHLQEQPVLNKEIYVNYKNQSSYDSGPVVDNDDVFGYQARYMEYRTKHSRISGAFRSTLSYWHMGRIFDRPPVLNMAFASTRDSAMTFLRPFAINAEQLDADYIYSEFYHNLQMIRKMPKYVYMKF